MFSQEIWRTISEGAKRLVRRMLERDVRKRVSAQWALQDGWILEQTKARNVVNLPKLEKALNNMSTFRVRGRGW